MPLKALLFDLDDTLLIDDPATFATFDVVAEHAAIHAPVETVRLSAAAKRAATELWTDSDVAAYCDEIGIAPYECLWARFDDPIPEIRKLAQWSPQFRIQVWEQALREGGLPDRSLAAELAQLFFSERRKRMVLMDGAVPLLENLRAGFQLGMLTNGAPGLQREKIAALSLEPFFERILVSGEIGVGKPNPEVFRELLRRMDIDPRDALMVGNSLERDVAGARSVGMRSVWIHVPGCGDEGTVQPDFTIRALPELLEIVRAL